MLKQPVAEPIPLEEQAEQIKAGLHHHKALAVQQAQTVTEQLEAAAAPPELELEQAAVVLVAGLAQVPVLAQELVAVQELAAVAALLEAAQEDNVNQNLMLNIKAHTPGLYFNPLLIIE